MEGNPTKSKQDLERKIQKNLVKANTISLLTTLAGAAIVHTTMSEHNIELDGLMKYLSVATSSATAIFGTRVGLWATSCFTSLHYKVKGIAYATTGVLGAEAIAYAGIYAYLS